MPPEQGAAEAAVAPEDAPEASSPSRRVLEWFGWTLLYTVVWIGGGWLISSLLSGSALSYLFSIGSVAAAAYLIGRRFRSDAWPLGPLFSGIGLPVAAIVYFAIASKIDSESLGVLWMLMLLAALVWLVPASAIMAGIAWLGVRHGKRRAAEGSGLPATAGPGRDPA